MAKISLRAVTCLRMECARFSFYFPCLNLAFPIMLCRLVFAVVVLSCFPATGWAQVPATPRPASDVGKPPVKKPIKRSDVAAPQRGSCHIGVIPIAGNLFRVERYGVVTLSDQVTRVGTEGWALDELVVSRVSAAAPGNSVRRIPFTKEELVRDAKERPRSFFRDDNVTIKEFAQSIAGRINCDRYVVIHRRGGGYREFGIGISRYPLFEKVFLFAMMQIRVYDGRTFELIKQGPATTEKENLVTRAFYGPPGGPSRELDVSAFPDRPADAAHNLALRDGVRALLTTSLDNTLPAMLR
jgi:hypothetical protein